MGIPNENVIECVKARLRLKGDTEAANLDGEKMSSLCDAVMSKLQIKLPQFLRNKHPDAETEKGKAEIKHQDINEYMVKTKLVDKASFNTDFSVVETKAETSS